jgi:hypothetical protein
MDESEAATQRLAQAARQLRLVSFRLLQLRHTNDQLLAMLQDLLEQLRLIVDGLPATGGRRARALPPHNPP